MNYRNLKVPLLAIAILSFAIGLYYAIGTTSNTFLALKNVGWNEAVPVWFRGFGCWASTECQSAFVKIFWRYYKLKSLYLVGGFVLLWGIAIVKLFAEPNYKRKDPGAARWSRRRDLKDYLSNKKSEADAVNPQRGYLGMLPSGKLLRIPEKLRCSNVLVVGGPGARKTTGYHRPNLIMDANDGVSSIVIDLKYPDPQGGFFDLISFFESRGRVVKLFIPYDANSHHLPILAGAESIEQAQLIANMLVPPSEGAGKFYRDLERQVLTTLLLVCVRKNITNIGELLSLVKSGPAKLKIFLNQQASLELRSELDAFFFCDDKTQASILNGLANSLEAFRHPMLALKTSMSSQAENNINIASLATEPTLLYIGIPQQYLLTESGKTLIGLIKRSIDYQLLNAANQNGGRCPVHVAFYLDEFPNLGKLPNAGTQFATLRSRNISHHVTVQNRAQGEAVYGKTEFHAMINNNFQSICFFPRFVQFEEARFFSDALGQTTVIQEARGKSRTWWLEKERSSRNTKEVAQALLSQEEMRSFPPGMAIWLLNGVAPTKAYLPRLDEKRMDGVRNKLHRFYLELQQQGTDLLDTLERLGAKHTEAITPLEQFTAWLDKVIIAKLPVTIYKNHERNEVTKVEIDKSYKDFGVLQVPNLKLHGWIAKGWLSLKKGKLGISEAGLAAIGLARQTELLSLDKEQNITMEVDLDDEVREEDSKATKSDELSALSDEDSSGDTLVEAEVSSGKEADAVSVQKTGNAGVGVSLDAWLEHNQFKLIGHPSRQLLPKELQPAAIGFYELNVQELPLKTTSKLFLEKMPAGFKATIEGDVKNVHLPCDLAKLLLEDEVEETASLTVVSSSFEELTSLKLDTEKKRRKVAGKRQVCYSFNLPIDKGVFI